MIVIPVPFLRSVGYAGMLIPLISVLVAITLLPVFLASFGQKVDWPRIRHEDKASRGWTGWARLIVRHRWIAAAIGIVILGVLIYPATQVRVGNPTANALGGTGTAQTGLRALESSGIGPGILTPFEVLVEANDPVVVARKLDGVPGVRAAVAPPGPGWRRLGTSLVEVMPVADGSTTTAQDTLARVRSVTRSLPGTVRVGGPSALNADFISAVYGSFPLMIALIAVLTFIVLARVFRSLLLPLKAVILNIASVAAALGLMVWVWQQGHGSQAIWGIAPTQAITAFIPLMAFAFLFGLSMDYEVFILARMREEYDATGSTEQAIVVGIGRTGRPVTSAALILFLAFSSLASGPETTIKIFATGVAAGILLDATVVRALLVPSLMMLFGRWNWWLPKFPARLLRVEPSQPDGAEPAPDEA
jgi:RND superfamily putative drug exporter